MAPVYKVAQDVDFDGLQTTVDVDVSAKMADARDGVWQLYDTDFTQIEGVIQPISAVVVRITVQPALAAGSYRLVGIA